MKRTQIIVVLIAALLNLTLGCSQGDKGIASNVQSDAVKKAHNLRIPDCLSDSQLSPLLFHESPLYTDTLPNNTIVQIYGVDTTDNPVTIGFSYTDEENHTTDRILQTGEWLDHFVLYDGTGAPLCGYQLEVNAELAIEFMFFNGENEIAATVPDDPNEIMTLDVIHNGQSASVDFNGQSEYDAAMLIYEMVYISGYDPDTFTLEEQALLSKAEQVLIWAENGPGAIMDMETATQLTLDGDFQEYIGAGYSSTQPLTKMPAALKAFCDIIKVVKQFCSLIGNQLVCMIIIILDIICNFLAQAMK